MFVQRDGFGSQSLIIFFDQILYMYVIEIYTQCSNETLYSMSTSSQYVKQTKDCCGRIELLSQHQNRLHELL